MSGMAGFGVQPVAGDMPVVQLLEAACHAVPGVSRMHVVQSCTVNPAQAREV